MITFAPANKNIVGAIAQLVEQRTENPCVPGSIPGGTTPPFIWGRFSREAALFCIIMRVEIQKNSKKLWRLFEIAYFCARITINLLTNRKQKIIK